MVDASDARTAEAYEAPRVDDLGSLTELTLNGATNPLKQDNGQGTPNLKS